MMMQKSDISWQNTAPITPTKSGTYPSMAEDDDYLYVTIDTDTWRRVALSNFGVVVDGSLALEGGVNLIGLEGGVNTIALE